MLHLFEQTDDPGLHGVQRRSNQHQLYQPEGEFDSKNMAAWQAAGPGTYLAEICDAAASEADAGLRAHGGRRADFNAGLCRR